MNFLQEELGAGNRPVGRERRAEGSGDEVGRIVTGSPALSASVMVGAPTVSTP